MFRYCGTFDCTFTEPRAARRANPGLKDSARLGQLKTVPPRNGPGTVLGVEVRLGMRLPRGVSGPRMRQVLRLLGLGGHAGRPGPSAQENSRR